MEAAGEEDKQLMHSHPPIVSQSYPWLVICDGDDLERQNIFSISKDQFYTRTIPEMRNKMILTSNDEWLVLEDQNSRDICLLNLLSKEVVQLPQLPQSESVLPRERWESVYKRDFICVLSSQSSDAKYHPHHIVFIERKTCVFYFCQLGDSDYIKQEFEFDLDDDRKKRIRAATMFGGRICFLVEYMIDQLGCASTLFGAEIIGPELRFAKLTRDVNHTISPLCIFQIDEYLVESCGELLYLRKLKYGFVGRKVYGIQVFRMDFSENVWVQVKSIGEHTIFLSEHTGISCFATELGVKRNSIYFTKFTNRFLHVFDLEDHSISMSLPCPIVRRCESELDWVMIPITNKL